MDRKHHDGFQRTCFNTGHSNHECASEYRQDAGLNPREIVRLLRRHVRLWIIPAAVCTVLAAAYALLASRDWRATQALIVRPEAASASDERLGKFSDLSEMKTLQETIFELAKSHGVVKATLEQVGPPNSRRARTWPAPLDIEEFREQVDMRPPGGAEFGKTEVFYLSVHDNDRLRASQTLAVLCNELEQRMQELRDQRAQSMVAELERTVEMAEHDLADRTVRLSQFESKIGADLVELRNLNATTGGQGEVSQELQTIEAERRANESLRRENLRLLALLEAAQDDPSQLLATPNSLLHSQPSLSRLKDALVDAQIRVAGLLGSRSERHPFVIAAREAEKFVRGELHDEIGVAVAGLNVELALNADREQSLVAKKHEARERLSRLAESRADYANLVSAAENHTKLVEAARKNLADARGRQAAAHSASVIGRIDGVEAGVRPVGPSRTTITAAGGIGGLILGLGLVFLFATPTVASANTRAKGLAPGFVGGVSDADDRAAERHPVRQSPAASLNTSVINPDATPSNHVLVGVPLTRNASIGPVTSVPPASSNHEKFGLFQGMTLEEAIRSAEGKSSSRSGQ